jgi:hypothetical protein
MSSLKLILAGLIAIAMTGLEVAEGAGGRWGVGSFMSYNVPLRSLSDRFSATSKYGFSWVYVANPRLHLEMEYHHSSFDDGELAKRSFTWSVDGQEYLSPGATSTMRFNSVSMNLMIFQEEPTFRSKDFLYYVEVGAGFYDYKAMTTGLIYPGQTTQPLDTTLRLQDQVDTQTALSVNGGLGVEAFVFDNVAVDMRARYHMVLGELRPYFDWGYDKKAVPLQLFDVGAGLKIYFWNE